VQRSGKSFFYLNFDDLRLSGFSRADYALLDSLISVSSSSLLFFDEIQSAPDWELYIRQKLDEGFQVVITGSNASLLSGELGSRLTGRHLSYELFPFSFSEYCSFRGEKRNRSSLESHLVSPSKLAPVIGLKSPSTILEYFSHFESSYLIQLVSRFSWSVKAQSLSPKKLYVIDPGLVRSGSLSFSPDRGSLLECFVFMEFRRHTKDIFYFSEGAGECDFVVHPHGASPLCVQVCLSVSADNESREVSGLVSALDFFHQVEGFILTLDSADTILVNGKTIHVVPAYGFDFSR
jgi:predicted AAA+ superfamily ATPase